MAKFTRLHSGIHRHAVKARELMPDYCQYPYDSLVPFYKRPERIDRVAELRERVANELPVFNEA